MLKEEHLKGRYVKSGKTRDRVQRYKNNDTKKVITIESKRRSEEQKKMAVRICLAGLSMLACGRALL